MLQIAQLIIRLMKGHRAALYNQLDLLNNNNNESKNSNRQPFRPRNLNYLYALGMVLFTTLYGIFGLVWEAQSAAILTWNLTAIMRSPFHHFHVCCPRQVWSQTDPIIGIITLGNVLVFGTLYLSLPPPTAVGQLQSWLN